MDTKRRYGHTDGYREGIADINRSGCKVRVNKKRFALALLTLVLVVAAGVASYLLLKGLMDEKSRSAMVQNPVDKPVASEPSAKVLGDSEAKADSPKKVVLDAGHGGIDSGALGLSGVREDELNLKVTNDVKALLESEGCEVIMTRTDENAIADTKAEDLEKRRQIISGSGSDIVVSIHMNSYTDPNSKGAIVIFMAGSAEGEKLANAVRDSINGGLKPETECKARSDNLFILRCGTQPSVIVECGFISNSEEEAMLEDEDYQKKIAEAITSGIGNYFGGEKKIYLK